MVEVAEVPAVAAVAEEAPSQQLVVEAVQQNAAGALRLVAQIVRQPALVAVRDIVKEPAKAVALEVVKALVHIKQGDMPPVVLSTTLVPPGLMVLLLNQKPSLTPTKLP